MLIKADNHNCGLLHSLADLSVGATLAVAHHLTGLSCKIAVLCSDMFRATARVAPTVSLQQLNKLQFEATQSPAGIGRGFICISNKSADGIDNSYLTLFFGYGILFTRLFSKGVDLFRE